MEESKNKFLKQYYSLSKIIKYRYVIKLLILILGPMLIFKVINDRNAVYSAYVNNRFIAYVEDKSEMRSNFKDIIKEVNSKYENVNFKKGTLKFEKVKDEEVLITDFKEAKKNVIKSLEGTLTAKKLIINNKAVGYVSSEDEKKVIMNLLTKSYLNDIGITEDKVTYVNILASMVLEDENIELSQIEPLEDIAKSIYAANNDRNPLLNIDIIIQNGSKENIIPTTTMISTDELYWGESKKEEGTPGEKEVLKEITYSNGKKVSEKNISERVITKAKDNIIYRGTKDPVANGIAFLDNPSRGSITSNYGLRWGRMHKGIDIAGKVGDPIRAAFDGKVIEASYSSSYGNVIVIDHGKGIQTLYAHCSKLLAKVGQEIKRGDLIAKIGNTGRSTGPHLHFELKVNGEAINPSKYID